MDVNVDSVTSSCNNISAQCDNQQLSTAAKIPLGFVLTIIVCMTISGNILVLLAMLVDKTLRTATHYIVVSLACADLLLGVLVLPFSAIRQLEGRWVFGSTFCHIWASTDVLCCTASILSLCAISIDRYIGVTRPLQHRTIMTGRRTLVIIVGLWASSFAISLGPLIGWRDKQGNPYTCSVTTKPGYVIFSTLCSFYIPATILLVVYYHIYREAILQVEFLKSGFKKAKTKGGSSGSNASRMTLRAVTKRSLQYQTSDSSVAQTSSTSEQLVRSPCVAQTPSTSEPTTRTPCGENSSSNEVSQVTRSNGQLSKRNSSRSSKLKRLRSQLTVGTGISNFNKERKAAKTLGIVVGVFLMCWFPFFIILPLSSLCQICAIPRTLFDVSFWLGYCNSMANPIIYATWNREFRKTFVTILKCQTKKKSQNVLSYLVNISTQQMAQTAADRRTITVQTATMQPFRRLPQWDNDMPNSDSVQSIALLAENIIDEDSSSNQSVSHL